MFGLEPTPFDVRLIAFRIPIRVHPSFWIAGVFLSGRFGQWDQMDLIFLWVACMFVSILVHELGHALMSEAFGWESEIVLYWCGGLAFSRRDHNRTPWREIAVSLAGPFAGFGLLALTMVVWYFLPASPADVPPPKQEIYLNYVMFSLFIINLFWGLMNLLPVLPLDGGQVCRSFLVWCGLRNPMRAAAMVSVLTAGLAAAFFFSVLRIQFTGIMFAILCLQNLASLQSDQ